MTPVVGNVRDNLTAWSSIAVVVPPSLMDDAAQALLDAGVPVNDSRRSLELTEPVTLTTGARVKGLEFDLVIVLEPSAIGSEEGLRALYVALTRAVQRLLIVHA